MHVKIDYPDADSELAILKLARKEQQEQADHINPILSKISQTDIFNARKQVTTIHMSEAVEEYIVQLTMATRHPKKYGDDLARWIDYGASPRATIALDRCSRAHAWLNDKDYVSPDDVRAVLHDVFRHRVLISFEAEAEGISSDQVINELIHRVPVA
jgi:MoxR-like ATPase